MRNRQVQLYEEHPVVQQILKSHPVAVLIRTDKLLGCPQVIVRGSHYQQTHVRDATLGLLGKLFNKASLIEDFIITTDKQICHLQKSAVVSTSFEVTQPQQNFLIGTDGANIDAVQRVTGAEICLPNPYRSETTIVISGTVDAVIEARQMLIVI